MALFKLNTYSCVQPQHSQREGKPMLTKKDAPGYLAVMAEIRRMQYSSHDTRVLVAIAGHHGRPYGIVPIINIDIMGSNWSAGQWPWPWSWEEHKAYRSDKECVQRQLSWVSLLRSHYRDLTTELASKSWGCCLTQNRDSLPDWNRTGILCSRMANWHGLGHPSSSTALEWPTGRPRSPGSSSIGVEASWNE